MSGQVTDGSFMYPTNGNAEQKFTINGVLMQNQTNAAGYFPGTNQSGVFWLGSP